MVSDINHIIKEFELGKIERIFICFYSYFIIGYLILFTIYENSFLNLELHSQIFLSIAINFPITTISAVLLTNKTKDKNTTSGNGYFYEATHEFTIISYFYSIIFVLFYIFKHLDLEIFNYDGKFDPVIGLVLIILVYIYLYFTS